MEPYCLQQSDWSGPVLGVMGDKLYIDFSDDTKLDAVGKALGTAIWTTVPSRKRKDWSFIPGEIMVHSPARRFALPLSLHVGEVVNVKLSQTNIVRGVLSNDSQGSLIIEILPPNVQNGPASLGPPDVADLHDAIGQVALNNQPQPSVPAAPPFDSTLRVEIALGQDALPLLSAMKATKGLAVANFRPKEIVAVPRTSGAVTFAEVLCVDEQPQWMRVLSKRGELLVEKSVQASEVYKVFATFVVRY